MVFYAGFLFYFMMLFTVKMYSNVLCGFKYFRDQCLFLLGERFKRASLDNFPFSSLKTPACGLWCCNFVFQITHFLLLFIYVYFC